MAKADPNDPAAEIDEIITSGRKKSLNFAMMKSKEGIVLKAHLTKSSEVMLREAKQAGGLPAMSVMGVLNVSGKRIELTVPTPDVPGALPKLAKRYLSSIGMKYQVVFILPGGGEIGGEDDEAEGAAPQAAAEAPPAQGAEPAPQPDLEAALKAELVARLKQLSPQLKSLMAASHPAAEKVSGAFKAAAGEISAGALNKAGGMVAKLEEVLARLLQPVDTGALRKQLEAEFSELGSGLSRLAAEANAGVAGKADKIAGMFGIELERDLKKTGQILTVLRKFVEDELAKLPANRPAPNPEAAQAPPPAEEAETKGFFSRIKSAIMGGKGKLEEAAEDTVSVVGDVLAQIEKAVSDGIDTVEAILADKADLLKMAGAYPQAALAANAAIEAFDATLGSDLTITPAVLAQAATDVGLAKDAVKTAKAALAQANAMKKGGARNKAIKAAIKVLADAEAAEAKAIAFEKAAKGKNLLETEMTIGALAPDSPHKLSQAAALELVKGASRDPDLTAVAFTATRDGAYPEDVALNLGKVIDHKEKGFAANGKATSAEAGADYAAKLVKMGGNVGPEYFARMDDYLLSGRQFLRDPTNESGAASFGELEQSRTLSVGKALVGPDGKLALDSQGASDAIGDALFNPTVLRNARPALTSHMLETVAFFEDPANATKANDILTGLPDPVDPAAVSVVQRATGKAPGDAVDKADAQGAVMASLLKSIDQGPVGSCFATAPARRLRETDPLATMGIYAEIAGSGTFTPPFGPQVPIVTNTQLGDDPIMRSFEYSLATSTAQKANSNQKNAVNYANNKGLETLGTAISTQKLADIQTLPEDERAAAIAAETTAAPLRLSKLKADVAAAFTFTYDPLDVIGVGADGSSDRGRYILCQISPAKDIRTKAEFVTAMKVAALASVGLADGDDGAQTVKDHVASDAFLNAVIQIHGTDPKKAYLPWSLGGGGQTGEATQTLHGATLTQQSMTAKAGNPKPEEGARTKQVLQGLLDGMAGKAGEMVTIRTVGQHGFNALPNEPSLAALKGDTPEERAQNIEDKLIAPGAAIKDAKLATRRVVEMYTKIAKPMLDAEADPVIKALLQTGFDAQMPTADLSPAELDKAVRDAIGPANAKRAEAEAEAWKTAQTAPVTDEALAAKKEAFETAKNDRAASRLATELIEACAPPEFVIADSNWGSGADHTFFVIAPDPATGEPLLWTKTIPPGTLRKAGRDWVDHEWAMID
jgi:hypothetical protein